MPTVEGLERRELLAFGQYSIVFRGGRAGGSTLPTIRGTLADGSIDVLDFNLSAFNSVVIGSSTGGAQAGKVQFGPLPLSFSVGPQTTPIFQVLAAGGSFDSATLTIRDSGARTVAVFDFQLVFATSQVLSTDGGSSLIENDTFEYGAIRLSLYNPSTARLTSSAAWSRVTNTATISIASAQSVSTASLASLSNDAVPIPVSAFDTIVTTTAPSSVPTQTSLRATTNGGFVATVTSRAGVPNGYVAFYSGNTYLDSVAVGTDGRAVLNGPLGLRRGQKVYAIFSDGAGSIFAPSSSVTNGAQVQRLFRNAFGRAMRPDEWAITSMWLNRGLNSSTMGGIYKKLAQNRG